MNASAPFSLVDRVAMSLSFDCPHCGTHMEILERFAGQSGACAICGQTISIPATKPPREPGSAIESQKPPAAEGLSLSATLSFVGGSVALFCVLFLVSVLVIRVAVPTVQTARVARLNGATLRNLEKIAAALNQYHDDHGSFPPAYFADEAGKPAHSWRVLILPQLGYEELYRQYDFNQAWDSNTNLLISNQMPREFRSPHVGAQALDGTTHFAVVMGKQTVFPYDKAASRSQVLDDHASVLTLVELHGMGFDWTDPASNYDLASPQGTLVVVNEVSPSLPLSASTLTGNVATLDGVAHHLSDQVAPQLLRDMATRSGSEYIDPDFESPFQP